MFIQFYFFQVLTDLLRYTQPYFFDVHISLFSFSSFSTRRWLSYNDDNNERCGAQSPSRFQIYDKSRCGLCSLLSTSIRRSYRFYKKDIDM
jgi:hypothetical protein